MTCECDCCDEPLSEGEALTDGFCPFCASTCFQTTAFADGRPMRVVFSRESRERLHAQRERLHAQRELREPDPQTPQEIGEQLALQAVEILKPHVGRLLTDGMAALRKIMRT